MNFFLDQIFKIRAEESCLIWIFLKSGIYQICKEKCNFFSCPRNWNCGSNLFCQTKMAQRIACVRKKTIGNFSSTLYSEKKKLKLLSKGSLNLSFTEVLRLIQKNYIISWFWYIYISAIIHRTLKEVHT